MLEHLLQPSGGLVVVAIMAEAYGKRATLTPNLMRQQEEPVHFGERHAGFLRSVRMLGRFRSLAPRRLHYADDGDFYCVDCWRQRNAGSGA